MSTAPIRIMRPPTAGRRASLNRVDDTFHLRAQFGVIQGTAMEKILDAFVEAEWQADWDAAKAEHGDDARTNMVARSQSQRRADALFAIFQAAVTGDGRAITDPLVHLVCDLASFEEEVARQTGGHVPEPDDHDRGQPRTTTRLILVIRWMLRWVPGSRCDAAKRSTATPSTPPT